MTPRWAHVGGVAALAAPVVMWTEFISTALSRPGYNLLTRATSDLAARGVPHAFAFTVGFFYLAGALTVLVGFVLAVEGHRSVLWRVGALMVVVAGIMLVLTGVFPKDAHSAFSTGMHNDVSQTCFAVAAASPLVLFLGSAGTDESRRHRRTWLTLGLVSLSIEVGAVALRSAIPFPDGLFQRPFTVVLTVWFVAMGVWLLGRARAAVPAPQRARRYLDW